MSLLDTLPNLPRPIARNTLFLLTEALPPPLSVLPEERAARDEAAVAAVAVLAPADAYQARLAARSAPPTRTPWSASASPVWPARTPTRHAAAAPRPP
jgi:hypothetical protein